MLIIHIRSYIIVVFTCIIQNNCWTGYCGSPFPHFWNLLWTDRFPKNNRNAFQMVFLLIRVTKWYHIYAVKVITIILSFIVAVWLISFLSIQLYNDRQRVRQIWLFRYGPDINGLWSIIVCFIGNELYGVAQRIKMIFSAAVVEIFLALASFTACLHYDDVVERLQLYNKLQHLAEIYPGAYNI